MREELRIALRRRIEFPSFRIIPIVLDDSIQPAFLRDYAHIDWRNGAEIASQRLLEAIRGEAPRPVLLAAEAGHVLAFALSSIRVKFFGPRGRRAVFTEHHRYKVLQPVDHLNKRLHYDGSCSYVRNSRFAVTRKQVSPHYEELRYDIMPPPLNVGDWLDVVEEYELIDNFRESSNHWTQYVESPIADSGDMQIVFDFTESTPILDMIAYLREAPRPIREAVQPIRDGSTFRWSKSFLTFGEQFTFRFQWKED